MVAHFCWLTGMRRRGKTCDGEGREEVVGRRGIEGRTFRLNRRTARRSVPALVVCARMPSMEMEAFLRPFRPPDSGGSLPRAAFVTSFALGSVVSAPQAGAGWGGQACCPGDGDATGYSVELFGCPKGGGGAGVPRESGVGVRRLTPAFAEATGGQSCHRTPKEARPGREQERVGWFGGATSIRVCPRRI